MKISDILLESKNHPIICVDVQPAYEFVDPKKIREIIYRVTSSLGPVLFFVNAEQDALTDDTVRSIQYFWYETASDAGLEIDWNRFTIVDKGYGAFRSWMDLGVDDASIIRVIRYLYQNDINSSEDIDYDVLAELINDFDNLKDAVMHSQIWINWTSVAQLKKFNNAYIVGGGRHECLREIELLMNAFNISYKRIDSLIYG